MKHKKLWIAASIVALAFAVFFFVRARGSDNASVVIATRGDLIKTVQVSGKVVPRRSADLGFQVGGTVAAVHKDVGESVKAGDVLAELDRASLSANLLKAQADLAAAEAELAKLQNGSIAQTKIDNAKSDAVQAILDAYTNADDAVRTKADQLFDDPRTPNPRIKYFFDGADLERAINNERVTIEGILVSWSQMIQGLNGSNYVPSDLSVSLSNLQSVASFLDDTARAVSGYKASDALPQATIDKYKADILAARANVNGSITTLIAKNTALSDTLADVPVQAANVAAAEAAVADAQAQLDNTQIKAPFSGVISRQDAKVGQSVSANNALVTIISKDYKVEAYVPEVSIAGLAVGNSASMTLDAYGASVVFPMTVSHIDPAETIRDGVSNYKIELVFGAPDDRARSGMTANVSIETLRKPGVVMIPVRSVLTKGATTSVFIKTSDDSIERIVKLGDTDTKGNIEVLSGLSSGETILLDPITK